MKKLAAIFIVLFTLLFTILISGCINRVRYKLEDSYNVLVEKNVSWDFDSVLYFKATTFEFHKKERLLILKGIRNFSGEFGSDSIVADYVEVEDGMIILYLLREFSYKITINGEKFSLESLDRR